jgi:hypothetical protein
MAVRAAGAAHVFGFHLETAVRTEYDAVPVLEAGQVDPRLPIDIGCAVHVRVVLVKSVWQFADAKTPTWCYQRNATPMFARQESNQARCSRRMPQLPTIRPSEHPRAVIRVQAIFL